MSPARDGLLALAEEAGAHGALSLIAMRVAERRGLVGPLRTWSDVLAAGRELRRRTAGALPPWPLPRREPFASPEVDDDSLTEAAEVLVAQRLGARDRRRAGAYYTPREIADAACHQQSNVRLAARAARQVCGVHRVAKLLGDHLVGHRDGQRQHGGRFAEAPHVTVEQKGLALVGPQGLVDAFTVQKPVIEDGDDGVRFVDNASVDADHGCHGASVPSGPRWVQGGPVDRRRCGSAGIRARVDPGPNVIQ